MGCVTIGIDELRKLTRLSGALQADQGVLGDIAVALVSRQAPTSVGRIAQLLYRRFEREAGSPLRRDLRFFRISPAGRMILTALRERALDYVELGSVLDLSPHEVEQVAWKCRLELAGGVYPNHPERTDTRCPDYDPSAPWTQAYLDHGDSSGSEGFFLRTHLGECIACRESLSLARGVLSRAHSQVDEAVPDPGCEAADLVALKDLLESISGPPVDVRGAFRRWLNSNDGKSALLIAFFFLVLSLLLHASQ